MGHARILLSPVGFFVLFKVSINFQNWALPYGKGPQYINSGQLLSFPVTFFGVLGLEFPGIEFPGPDQIFPGIFLDSARVGYLRESVQFGVSNLFYQDRLDIYYVLYSVLL